MRRSATVAIGALGLGIVGVVAVGALKLCGDAQHETLSELLLVFVLSVEGIVAVLHLEQERRHSQTDALIDVMKELASQEALRDTYLIYEHCAPSQDNLHASGAKLLEWQYKNGQYEVTRGDGTPKPVKITLDDSLWAAINRTIERYQRVGLLLKHGHIAPDELLQWGHVPVIRMWQRLGNLVLSERQRRPSPELWKYFEEFKGAAESYHRGLAQTPPGGPV